MQSHGRRGTGRPPPTTPLTLPTKRLRCCTIPRQCRRGSLRSRFTIPWRWSHGKNSSSCSRETLLFLKAHHKSHRDTETLFSSLCLCASVVESDVAPHAILALP